MLNEDEDHLMIDVRFPWIEYILEPGRIRRRAHSGDAPPRWAGKWSYAGNGAWDYEGSLD